MNVTFRFCWFTPSNSLKLPVFKGVFTDLGSHSFLHISFYPLYNVVAEKLVSITENVVSQSASYAQPIIETVKKTTTNVVETVKEVGRKVKDKAKKAWAWLTGR